MTAEEDAYLALLRLPLGKWPRVSGEVQEALVVMCEAVADDRRTCPQLIQDEFEALAIMNKPAPSADAVALADKLKAEIGRQGGVQRFNQFAVPLIEAYRTEAWDAAVETAAAYFEGRAEYFNKRLLGTSIQEAAASADLRIAQEIRNITQAQKPSSA